MNLSPLPIQKFFDNAGRPLNGGLLFTYVATTTTKLATYQDQAGTPNTNPVVLNFRGEANVWLDQTLTYKFVLAPEGDTDPPTRPIWSVDNISAGITFASLTQQIIGQLLYPKSPGESAAGVTIVNFYYPYGYWDRYATNTVPGTTDMATAANAAYQVAKQTRCSVNWGATAPYRLNGPINCTSMRGIVSWDESSANQSAGVPSVIIAHTGHGFDHSASSEMTFNNVVPSNLAGTVPKSAFFAARNSVGSGAGAHRYNNIRTPSACTFSNIFYWYGSEENVISDSLLYNSQPGSAVVNINATNPSAYVSTFVTIATGIQSNVTHFIKTTDIFNLGNSGGFNEVCVALEQAGNVSWVQGSAYCPHGLAYISIGGTVGMNFLTIDSVRGETDGAATTLHAIAVRTSAATGADTHTHWKIGQLALSTVSGGYIIDCNATSDIADLTMLNCFSSSGNLLNLHSLSNSIIQHGAQVIVGQVGGNVSSNSFFGTRSNISLGGTNTLNTGFDQSTGRTWQSGDSFSAPSTACTGAITTAVTWSLVQTNKVVLITLPALSAVATAAASFTYGSAIPAAYRPSADMRIPIIVTDNGTAQVGVIIVTAASGVMTVYKNPSSAGNFTAAGGAGLPGNAEINWTL